MSTKIKKLINYLNHRENKVIPKIPKFFKVSLILIAIISTFFIARSRILKAQNTEGILTQEALESHPLKQYQDARKKPNNLENWTNSALVSNAGSGLIAVTGEIPDDVISGKETTWIPGGLMGQSVKYIGYLYTPPASGTQYIANSFNNFLGKPTYAQSGVGFNGLQALLPLWKAFRNVIYIVISIAFILMGLMIMLRIKISPQAVITIQSSIPKLISTLILVTFSYAIAGLLIDLAYVIPAVFVTILMKSSGPIMENFASTQGVIFRGIFGAILHPRMIDSIYGTSNDIILNNIDPNTWTLFNNIGNFAPIFGASQVAMLLGIAMMPITVGASVVVGALAAILMPFIFSIMILIWVIKFFIGLVKCYIQVLLKVILAPLEIGLGAIPNMKVGFKSWFLGLVGNLAVFPISVLFITIVNIINTTMKDGGRIWTPNVLNLDAGSNTVRYLIGIGAVMLLPKLPKLIPEVIFSLETSPFGKAIGETAGGITKNPVVNTARSAGASFLEKKFDERFTKGKKSKATPGAMPGKNTNADASGYVHPNAAADVKKEKLEP